MAIKAIGMAERILDIGKQLQNDMQRIAASAYSDEIKQRIGIIAERELKIHWQMLADERHHAWADENFYETAADLTDFDITGDIVTAWTAGPAGIAQRIHGGTIVPVNGGKYLTIPDYDNHDAYNHAAEDFDFLAPMIRTVGGQRKAIALIRKGTDKSAKVGSATFSSVEIYYWLKESVTQQPDPTVEPDADAIMGKITENLNEYFSQYHGEISITQ